MSIKIEVSREQLEAAANRLSDLGQAHLSEPLFALLLAAPVVERQDTQVATMPVERCYDVRAKMIIAFNEAKKIGGDLDDALDAAYKSALRYSPNPLMEAPPQLAELQAEIERLRKAAELSAKVGAPNFHAKNREIKRLQATIATLDSNIFRQSERITSQQSTIERQAAEIQQLKGLIGRVYDADLAARHCQPYNTSKLMDEIDSILNGEKP